MFSDELCENHAIRVSIGCVFFTYSCGLLAYGCIFSHGYLFGSFCLRLGVV